MANKIEQVLGKLKNSEIFSELTREPCDPKYKQRDISAVRALTQAAVNVELFTIPLYMTSMYSIQGMHQITGKKNDFYKGRLWPGAAPQADPHAGERKPAVGEIDSHNPVNKKSFNTIFSVFIQEMLHLQMAANICAALGKPYEGADETIADHLKQQASPVFTGSALQNSPDSEYPGGWHCYDGTPRIPHIVDLSDMKEGVCFAEDGSRLVEQGDCAAVGMPLHDVKVKLGPLDANAITLFMAIEADEDLIRGGLQDEERENYFPTVPFDNWNTDSTEDNLPSFGSIAHMYTCLAEYLNIEYTDGTRLFDLMFCKKSAQQDLFNYSNRKEHGGHPFAEFPAMGDLMVTAADPETAKLQIFNMMSGITDQGEGSMLKVAPTRMKTLVQGLKRELLDKNNASHNVERRYQPDHAALEEDYPTYNDDGDKEEKSAHAHARATRGEHDHFERFLRVARDVREGSVSTWDQWHTASGEKPWQAQWLQTADVSESRYKIPSAAEVASALNHIKLYDLNIQPESGDVAEVATTEPLLCGDMQLSQKNYELFSHVAAGSIAGITNVLDDFWDYCKFNDEEKSPVAFPFPSMAGSGDRIAICWAIFGRAPDLSLGEYPRASGKTGQGDTPVNHACQGLSFRNKGEMDACASLGVYHTCKGSNNCAGEGGCGFVHDAFKAGSGCSSSVSTGGSGTESAPGGNMCASRGGCAVPISASQLFPKEGEMQLFNLKEKGEKSWEPATFDDKGVMEYKKGEPVYDVAWRAYQSVMQGKLVAQEDIDSAKDGDPLKMPDANLLRIAFPPST
ncbi:MAG: ferritin-like protein [Marinobacterium sp.]|nr:ferritin-like protein [Marinobacterium sp.]